MRWFFVFIRDPTGVISVRVESNYDYSWKRIIPVSDNIPINSDWVISDLDPQGNEVLVYSTTCDSFYNWREAIQRTTNANESN